MGLGPNRGLRLCRFPRTLKGPGSITAKPLIPSRAGRVGDRPILPMFGGIVGLPCSGCCIPRLFLKTVTLGLLA